MKLTLEPNKVTLNAALDKDIIIERMLDGSTKVSIDEYQYEMNECACKRHYRNKLI